MKRTYREAEQIHQLVERNKNNVYRLAFVYCKNHSDADDIFQEVFLRFCKAQPEFESLEHEKAWFLRVTINCCKSLLKSAWFRKTTALEDTLVYNTPENSHLLEEIMKLPQKYKTVIYLHFYEGYTLEEIAQMIEKNPSTVRTWLQRGKAALKTILEKEGEEWNENLKSS